MFEAVRKKAAEFAAETRVRRLVSHCHKLLGERGEASGVSLAREGLAMYAELDRPQRLGFFLSLMSEFSPDPEQVLEAAQRYARHTSPEALFELNRVVEPPRQELIRRLNRAPGGTAAIVNMREHLLGFLKETPVLTAVDWDFHHLLSSWFNPGFLQIVRVDWRTPALLLEKIIKHEAVHEIQGWNDLHRRLESDRRLFAFFHPALPEEPLIFVEVALVEEMADAIGPLIDIDGARGDPARASTAVFYSISNCQAGLRGVSLGNFLIKQVVDVLQAEFPKLKTFCTLSPIPGFGSWLASALKGGETPRNKEMAAAIEAVRKGLGPDGLKAATDPSRAPEIIAPLRESLMALCATYLLDSGNGDDPARDPVARFHLNNGARMERLNWQGNPARRGLRESVGMMVNYLYEKKSIDANHESFKNGRLVASRQVRQLAFGG